MAIHERLGDSEQARLLRARHQSAQLKSDMQAFKACNPGCVLEDFVRWHSPRAWLTGGHDLCTDERGEGGRLSERFHEPDNLWSVLWGATFPVPASQQREALEATAAAQAAAQAAAALAAAQANGGGDGASLRPFFCRGENEGHGEKDERRAAAT